MAAGGEGRSVARQVGIEVVAVGVSLAVTLGLTGAVIGLEAQSARANANAVVRSAEAGDLKSLVSSVERLQRNTRALAGYTSSPAWFITQYIPAIGNPVRAASTVLNGANDVSASAQGFVDIARTLGTTSKQNGQLLPPEVVAQLGTAGTELAAALERFNGELSAIDINTAFGPVRGTAESALADARKLLPELILLLRTLPSIATLLGSQDPQTWFVVLQNGGESRGTGGLVGSFANVVFSNGKSKTTAVGSNDLLTAKANPAVVPPDSQALWGPARLAEIYGVNLSPNFPYAGELISSLWKKQTGNAPDALLTLDQRGAAALIGATGPITVNGIVVTGANAEQILTVEVYRRYPNSVDKDAFVTQLIQQLMQRITSGAISPLKIASALMDSVLHREVFIWAADPQLQSSIAPSIIGGVVPDSAGPFAMAVVNNNAGNKMDTFLHTSVQYLAGECIVGGRRATLNVELFNDPPANLPPYVNQRGDRGTLWGGDSTGDGSNRVRVAVYLPKGAFLAKSVPNQLFVGQERGHPVAVFGVDLKAGQRKAISVEFTQFGGPELVNEAPNVLAQPMLNRQEISVVTGQRC